MKRCGINPLLAFLLTQLRLAVPLAALSLARGAGGPASDRALLLCAVLLLLGSVGSMRSNIDRLSRWLEYDDHQIRFHITPSDVRAVPWLEILDRTPSARRWNGLPRVGFQESLSGLSIVFRDDGRRMVLYRAASGYRAFVRELRERGAFL